MGLAVSIRSYDVSRNTGATGFLKHFRMRETAVCPDIAIPIAFCPVHASCARLTCGGSYTQTRAIMLRRRGARFGGISRAWRRASTLASVRRASQMERDSMVRATRAAVPTTSSIGTIKGTVAASQFHHRHDSRNRAVRSGRENRCRTEYGKQAGGTGGQSQAKAARALPQATRLRSVKG